MTTLELAEKIAWSVLAEAYESGYGFQWEHAHEHASAVFRVLRETDSWLCRMPKDADGETREEDITPYEQLDLFRR